VEGLAREIGVDPTGLVETIRVQNEFTRTAVDTDFGKGWGATGTAMTLAAR
jgi:3-oxosteroid 1-dehydrogenase